MSCSPSTHGQGTCRDGTLSPDVKEANGPTDDAPRHSGRTAPSRAAGALPPGARRQPHCVSSHMRTGVLGSGRPGCSPAPQVIRAESQTEPSSEQRAPIPSGAGRSPPGPRAEQGPRHPRLCTLPQPRGHGRERQGGRTRWGNFRRQQRDIPPRPPPFPGPLSAVRRRAQEGPFQQRNESGRRESTGRAGTTHPRRRPGVGIWGPRATRLNPPHNDGETDSVQPQPLASGKPRVCGCHHFNPHGACGPLVSSCAETNSQTRRTVTAAGRPLTLPLTPGLSPWIQGTGDRGWVFVVSTLQFGRTGIRAPPTASPGLLLGLTVQPGPARRPSQATTRGCRPCPRASGTPMN